MAEADIVERLLARCGRHLDASDELAGEAAMVIVQMRKQLAELQGFVRAYQAMVRDDPEGAFLAILQQVGMGRR